MTQAVLSHFSAAVERGVLTVTHRLDGVQRTLCVTRSRSALALLVQGQCVSLVQKYGGETIIRAPDGTDPGDLSTQIAEALRIDRQYRSKRRWFFGAVVTILVLSAATLIFPLTHQDSDYPQRRSVAASGHASLPPASKDVLPAPFLPNGATEPLPGTSVDAPSSPALPSDGWALPASIRAGLPAKLRKAADRKYFTVDYSSGHARTLYVFADPECPNCQRLEPVLNAVSATYNVVVFPVAVIGQEKSIASVTPVLCLPPEQRKAAWDALFDANVDVMNLGKPTQAKEPTDQEDLARCDMANKALGVNEVAYQTYRIPGTPWVVADNGQHVPQDVLQDPTRLNALMQASEATDAAH
jgi:TrbB protein